MPGLLPEARAASELRRLLPALQPFLLSLPPTAATILSATAHFAALPHRAECPVQRRALSLRAIADDAAFLSRPCAHCAARRAHFLAGEDFAALFARHCAGPAGSAGSFAMPSDFAAAAAAQFGSRAALESALVAAAAGRAAPGLAWLTCSAERRLAVLAPPPGRVPLSDGLWPIAVVDASAPRVLAAIERSRAKERERAEKPPKWSRAARNAAAAVTTTKEGVGEEFGESLAAVRLRVARDAVAGMHWGFVHQQWSAAEVYYTSPERTDRVRARRAELEHEAALAAMGRLRDSGATILTSDTVEITTRPTSEDAATSAGTTANSTAEAATTTATTTPAPATTTTTTTTEATESDVTDPECAQLSDGTWEYRYRSGDVTLLRPDGTRIFKRSDLTTTVYANGGTLFEYPNGTSILDRPDGVRVTTFADGTTTEEQIQ